MKRIIFFVCALLSVQLISAQIITSAQVGKVEKIRKVWDKEPHEKGWRGFAEIAYTVDCNAHSGLELMATYGYQFNNWIYAGAGGGLMVMGITGYYVEMEHNGEEYDDSNAFLFKDRDGNIRYDEWGPDSYEDEWERCFWNNKTHKGHDKDDMYNANYNTALATLPLYANVRAFFLSTKVKPYCDIKLGGMIPLGAKEIYYSKMTCNYIDKYHDGCSELVRAKYRYGGIYFQAGLGAEYRQYSLSFNYSLKGITALRLDESNEVIDKKREINPGIFTFNFGYSF